MGGVENLVKAETKAHKHSNIPTDRQTDGRSGQEASSQQCVKLAGGKGCVRIGPRRAAPVESEDHVKEEQQVKVLAMVMD